MSTLAAVVSRPLVVRSIPGQIGSFSFDGGEGRAWCEGVLRAGEQGAIERAWGGKVGGDA